MSNNLKSTFDNTINQDDFDDFMKDFETLHEIEIKSQYES